MVIEDPELVNSYIHSGQWDYTDIPEAENTEVVTVKAYLPVDEELDEKLRSFEREVNALAGHNVDKGPGAISCNEIQDEDWAENWKQYFHTEKVGDITVIKPTWEEYEASPDDVVIELDPGEAFGTGNHPTTAMVRSAIRQQEIDGNGKQALDDEGVIAIISKEVKMRKDSLEEFKKGDRQDLVAQTEAEIAVLMPYLPQQLSEEEIRAFVQEAVEKSGASSQKDMGKVMPPRFVIMPPA